MQKKKTVIGSAAAAAVVVGLGTWWTVAATAETESAERGTCAGATWELSAEQEDGGTEVDAELQSAGPGEEWEVELTRDGTVLLTGTRTTDEDGEIDLDVFSSGAPGGATYAVTFAPIDGEPCTAELVS